MTYGCQIQWLNLFEIKNRKTVRSSLVRVQYLKLSDCIVEVPCFQMRKYMFTLASYQYYCIYPDYYYTLLKATSQVTSCFISYIQQLVTCPQPAHIHDHSLCRCSLYRKCIFTGKSSVYLEKSSVTSYLKKQIINLLKLLRFKHL